MKHLVEAFLDEHSMFINEAIINLHNESITSADIEKIRCDNCCGIGIWLDRIRKRFHANADYMELCKIHTIFHKDTADIIRRGINGHKIDAINELVHINSVKGGAFCGMLESLTKLTRRIDYTSYELFFSPKQF